MAGDAACGNGDAEVTVPFPPTIEQIDRLIVQMRRYLCWTYAAQALLCMGSALNIATAIRIANSDPLISAMLVLLAGAMAILFISYARGQREIRTMIANLRVCRKRLRGILGMQP
jgi:hypothetical protein